MARLVISTNSVGGHAISIPRLERVVPLPYLLIYLTTTFVKVLEQFDLFLTHKSENQGKDLHEHGDICAKDKYHHVVHSHFVIVAVGSEPEILPIIKGS